MSPYSHLPPKPPHPLCPLLRLRLRLRLRLLLLVPLLPPVSLVLVTMAKMTAAERASKDALSVQKAAASIAKKDALTVQKVAAAIARNARRAVAKKNLKKAKMMHAGLSPDQVAEHVIMQGMLFADADAVLRRRSASAAAAAAAAAFAESFAEVDDAEKDAAEQAADAELFAMMMEHEPPSPDALPVV